MSPPSGPPTKRKFPVRPAPLTTDRERSPFLLTFAVITGNDLSGVGCPLELHFQQPARHDARGYPMPDERLEVSVTFDERGYIGSAPELRQAVVALSLGGLRRKIEIAMLPDDVRVVLQLDDLAERERHRGGRRRSYCAA